MYQILKKAAEKAGEIQLKYFNSSLDITQKTSQHNIVTQVDYECQEIIVKTLISELVKTGINKKDIGFIGEENLSQKGKYTFIIDPLDGTSNYASSFPYFCVSIALFVDKIPQSGIIYNPASKEMFYAEKDKGAFKILKNQKTKLKINHNTKEFLMTTHISSRAEPREKFMKILPKIFPLVRSNRELGSIALELCHHCENMFGLVINNGKIWDIAAAGIIIKESGGQLYDWQGKEIDYDFENTEKAYEFIACINNSLDKVIDILN